MAAIMSAGRFYRVGVPIEQSVFVVVVALIGLAAICEIIQTSTLRLLLRHFRTTTHTLAIRDSRETRNAGATL